MSGDRQSLAPPRGMRDFYPADRAVQDRIFDVWRASAERFGFQRYDACVVESLELLKRKGGEEIVEQIYTFKDKSGRDLALRPEMTPTLARMIAARQGTLELPIKWFTIAQCFRYERMTRGRKREHYQWNLDIIGEPDVTAEIEVLATAIDALLNLGLRPGGFRVHINSRALLADLFDAAGIPASHHPATFLALDKRGKQPDDQIRGLLADEGVPDAGADRIFDLMGVRSLDDIRARLGRATPALTQLEQCFAGLDTYGLGEHAIFDIAVIRGLAYYTGMVFEAFDADRSFRAIFGGGRYDNLLATVGGKPQTGVGFGFGDVVIAEILAEGPGDAADKARRFCTVVGFMEPGQQAFALRAAAALRTAGQDVDLALHPEKPRAFFSRANKRNLARAVFIGPDDVAAGAVRVKDMVSGEEVMVTV